jgi:hypothetical protein
MNTPAPHPEPVPSSKHLSVSVNIHGALTSYAAHMHADTMEDLLALIAKLNAQIAILSGGTTVELTGQSGMSNPNPLPPAKRGRPKKEEAEEQAPASAQAAQANPVAGVFANTTMTPAELRAEGKKALMDAFAADQASMSPKVTAIMQKFGVAKIDDVPDDKAADFHAEALLASKGV